MPRLFVRLGVARRQAQRLAERTLGLGVGLAHEMAVAQVVVRVGEVGHQAQRPAGAGLALLDPLEAQQHGGEVVVHARIPGRPPDRTTAVPLRLAEPAEREQSATHALERLDVGRLELKRALEAVAGLVRLLGRLIGEAQIVVIDRIAAVDGNRACQIIDRGVRGAALAGQHAEKLERVRVLRMCGENFVVKPLGVVEAAGAMMVDRRLEIARERALDGRPGAARRLPVRHRRAPGAARRLASSWSRINGRVSTGRYRRCASRARG